MQTVLLRPLASHDPPLLPFSGVLYSNTIPLTWQPGSITKRSDVIIGVKRNGFSLKVVTALRGRWGGGGREGPANRQMKEKGMSEYWEEIQEEEEREE